MSQFNRITNVDSPSGAGRQMAPMWDSDGNAWLSSYGSESTVLLTSQDGYPGITRRPTHHHGPYHHLRF